MKKGYEERYLINIIAAVMNQKETPEPFRQLNWEKMFRLADFHHVAHIVYYGIMGLTETIPQPIQKKFFQKYLEAVHRTERLRKGEKQLKAVMEYKEIHCFFLNYSEMVKHYPIEEMCCSEFIEIGTDKKNTDPIANLLRIRDFTERPIQENGYLYYRIPSVKVFFYDYNIFFSRPMRRFFKSLLKSPVREKNSKFVKEISLDDQYLFRMCRLTDCYAKGEISLNQIIDFWVFYKTYAEEFSWKYIYERLKKLKISEFAERLEYLVLRWFGTGAAVENAEIYEAIEAYILSKGIEGREVSEQYLPLIKTVADCYERNKKAEKLAKLLEWTFPDRRYMETIYPVIEKAGVLLPLFWIIRLARYGIRVCFSKIKESPVFRGVVKLKIFLFHLPIRKKNAFPPETEEQVSISITLPEGEELKEETKVNPNETISEEEEKTVEIPK
ncbi:nucleotidyltransferase family protein [Lacrimispora sp. JR3]|uniref:nucleotidyltransferase family protein n=1 Tax=Lacrimispora sinapis TaxID=3111456 RepID=UPI0037483191